MKRAYLILPHQLFEDVSWMTQDGIVYLVEAHLLFKQYNFHKQKISFHRASMKFYEHFLKSKGYQVVYIEAHDERSSILELKNFFKNEGINNLQYIDPSDYLLEQRLKSMEEYLNIQVHNSPQFLNTKNDLASFFRPDKKSFFQTSFYKQQRKKRKLLIDKTGEPIGGKWSFDSENRKKYPKNKIPPAIHYPQIDSFWKEALTYTEKYFPNHLGVVRDKYYPTTHQEAKDWLKQFLHHRFIDFGPYEDAIVKEQSILNHSVLSPLLNSGLITPEEVISQTMKFIDDNDIPINSTEGFLRQIVGWREFIRGMYWSKGSYSRTRNFWNFNRKIPKSFYDGTTGIDPIDTTIKKLLKTGYCNHIERLMILGNFMLLCEFDPDEVYQWFMEMFIDAYDWVMVPNVYGMCLFADGGTFSTKPYIGGANYIRKMSNFPKGAWESTWTALFWCFVYEHQDFFQSNPRTAMLMSSLKRMDSDKIQEYLQIKKEFLTQLEK